jgi:hypothetical protein
VRQKAGKSKSRRIRHRIDAPLHVACYNIAIAISADTTIPLLFCRSRRNQVLLEWYGELIRTPPNPINFYLASSRQAP